MGKGTYCAALAKSGACGDTGDAAAGTTKNEKTNGKSIVHAIEITCFRVPGERGKTDRRHTRSGGETRSCESEQKGRASTEERRTPPRMNRFSRGGSSVPKRLVTAKRRKRSGEKTQMAQNEFAGRASGEARPEDGEDEEENAEERDIGENFAHGARQASEEDGRNWETLEKSDEFAVSRTGLAIRKGRRRGMRRKQTPRGDFRFLRWGQCECESFALLFLFQGDAKKNRKKARRNIRKDERGKIYIGVVRQLEMRQKSAKRQTALATAQRARNSLVSKRYKGIHGHTYPETVLQLLRFFVSL